MLLYNSVSSQKIFKHIWPDDLYVLLLMKINIAGHFYMVPLWYIHTYRHVMSVLRHDWSYVSILKELIL